MNDRNWDDQSQSGSNWDRNRFDRNEDFRSRDYDDNYGKTGYSSSYDRSRLEQDNYGYTGNQRRNYEYDHEYGLQRSGNKYNNRQGMESDRYRNQMQSMSGNRDFDSWNDRNRNYGASYGSGYSNMGDRSREYGDRYNPTYRGGYMGTGGYGGGRDFDRTGNRDRDWWDRTKDEVSSWFGDEDAERRRERDRVSGPHRGKGPKDYKRSDDRIREDVCDRLSDDDRIDASNVQVQIQGDEVILTGTVHSKEEKRRAEDLVESISGVRNVENRLRVSHDNDSLLGRSTGSDMNSSERSWNR